MQGQNIKKYYMKLYYFFTVWQNVPQKPKELKCKNVLIIDFEGQHETKY